MKKTMLVIALVLVGCVAGGVYWWGAKRLWSRLVTPAAVELRATQQDEDAVPAPEPAVSVQVNGGTDAMVARGGPLLITVAATQRYAVNVASRLRMLQGRALRPGIDQPSLQRIRASVAALEAAVQLRLGDGEHPWTQTVQITLRPKAGGERSRWALRQLSSQASGGVRNAATPGVAVLDAESSAEVHFLPEPGPWAALRAGEYEVGACLAASGGWKGTACGPTARLTVVESEAQLTAEQRNAIDYHGIETAFLAEDWAELERRGNALLARDKFAGHRALGDASFGRKNWDVALSHYTAARAAWPKKNIDIPRTLNIRISQLLKILGAEE